MIDGTLSIAPTLRGQVAFVTGGARGIGRHVALRLAQGGASVAVGCHTNLPAAEETVSQIVSLGGRAVAVFGDLADATATEAMVDAIESGLGPVSILVHNAAPPRKPASLVNDTWEQFDTHYRVGVQAAWVLARRVAPAMRERSFGRIIIVTTTSVNLYVPGFGAYSAAKAALNTFAHYLAVELGQDGITVNVVAPGLTQKDETQPQPTGVETLPMARIAHASDIAEAVACFADPAAGALTGTIVPVDCGVRLLEPIRGRAIS